MSVAGIPTQSVQSTLPRAQPPADANEATENGSLCPPRLIIVAKGLAETTTRHIVIRLRVNGRSAPSN